MTEFISKKEILLLSRRVKTHEYIDPEFGTFYIKELTGKEHDEYTQWLVSSNEKTRHLHLQARQAMLVLTDKNGDRLFNIEDLAAISELPARLLVRINDFAKKINNPGEDDIKKSQED